MKEINKIISIRKEYFKIWGILEECYRFYGDIYEGDNADKEIKKAEKRFKQKYHSIEQKYGLNDYQCLKLLNENEIRNRMKKRIKANYCTSSKVKSNNVDFDFPF